MTHAPRPTRFAGESWRTASAMHARVVGAVIMRDLQTRFGAGYFGFLLGLIMPLGHLGIALVILTGIGRVAPIGSSISLFAMTGVLPFIIWLYCHRQILATHQQNSPLLYFPGVDIFDLYTARTAIEIVSATLVVTVVLSTLFFIGFNIRPESPFGFVLGLIQAWLLGIGTGLAFGSVAKLWPPFSIVGSLLGPLFWVTSGVVYIPDTAPEQVRNFLFYLPLCQIVDGLRTQFFPAYESSFYNQNIPVIFILSIITIGLCFVYIIRKLT